MSEISQHPNIKILVAYHKPSVLFSNNIMTPIHVGRALAASSQKESSFFSDMLGDDTGQNISHLNPYYSEMTACYWAWKNYEQLGSPDYFGLAHYRRFFGFTFDSTDGYISVPDITKVSPLLYDERAITATVVKYDMCVRAPIAITRDITDSEGNIIGKESVDPIVQYAYAHDVRHLEMALAIVLRRHPQYSEAVKVFIDSSEHYLCNLFVMRKQMFFKYAQWIFPLLKMLHNSVSYENLDDYQRRAVGFLAERLTGLFVIHHKLHSLADIQHIAGVDIG